MKVHAQSKPSSRSRAHMLSIPNALAHQEQYRQAMRRARVQPRLDIGGVNDPLEREADAAAERVLRMPEPLEKEPQQATQENLVQTKTSTDFATTSSPQFVSCLNSLSHCGSPLDASSRAFFEPRFGEDFSHVRLHTDPSAAQMAQALHAKAFTLGNNIVFGTNEYSTHTPEGKNLLGHELTHVIQQKGSHSSALQAKRVEKAPECSEENWRALEEQAGACLSPSQAWEMTEGAVQTSQESTDQSAFEAAIEALRIEGATLGGYAWNDAFVRADYTRRISAMAMELRRQAETGAISWAEAAKRASETRNTIMELMRNKSTPIGVAGAERMKLSGKPLNELIARYTVKLFGEGVRFESLSIADQNRVYGKIVESAGRSNAKVDAIMKRLGSAGKGLIVFSVAVSVYNVYVAEDKASAATREVAVTGAGILGGMAGGALAGLACGPGAPVCVAIGTFVGGALAAFGVSWFW